MTHQLRTTSLELAGAFSTLLSSKRTQRDNCRTRLGDIQQDSLLLSKETVCLPGVGLGWVNGLRCMLVFKKGCYYGAQVAGLRTVLASDNSRVVPMAVWVPVELVPRPLQYVLISAYPTFTV